MFSGAVRVQVGHPYTGRCYYRGAMFDDVYSAAWWRCLHKHRSAARARGCGAAELKRVRKLGPVEVVQPGPAGLAAIGAPEPTRVAPL